MKTRLSTDLGDPKLMQFLKLEAQETGTSMREVLIRALESYFSHRQQTHVLSKASESIFGDWNNSRDSDYDQL